LPDLIRQSMAGATHGIDNGSSPGVTGEFGEALCERCRLGMTGEFRKRCVGAAICFGYRRAILLGALDEFGIPLPCLRVDQSAATAL
jgi:hypothetical protein